MICLVVSGMQLFAIWKTYDSHDAFLHVWVVFVLLQICDLTQLLEREVDKRGYLRRAYRVKVLHQRGHHVSNNKHELSANYSRE
jgi:hypothetical protein